MEAGDLVKLFREAVGNWGKSGGWSCAGDELKQRVAVKRMGVKGVLINYQAGVLIGAEETAGEEDCEN